jgi:hypothetical protein
MKHQLYFAAVSGLTAAVDAGFLPWIKDSDSPSWTPPKETSPAEKDMLGIMPAPTGAPTAVDMELAKRAVIRDTNTCGFISGLTGKLPRLFCPDLGVVSR